MIWVKLRGKVYQYVAGYYDLANVGFRWANTDLIVEISSFWEQSSVRTEGVEQSTKATEREMWSALSAARVWGRCGRHACSLHQHASTPSLCSVIRRRRPCCWPGSQRYAGARASCQIAIKGKALVCGGSIVISTDTVGRRRCCGPGQVCGWIR